MAPQEDPTPPVITRINAIEVMKRRCGFSSPMESLISTSDWLGQMFNGLIVMLLGGPLFVQALVYFGP